MISFIIPTRNEEKALPRTLASLSVYSGSKEIIVSDDDSSDGTIKAAEKYVDLIIKNKDSRMTIAANRDLAASRAKGDYLVFADADSYVLDADNFFKEAEKMFLADPKLMALTFFNRFTPSIETWADKIILFYFNNATALINLFGFGSCFGKLHMIRTEAFRKVGGYNKNIVASEDVELFHRLAKIGRVRSSRSLIVYHSGRRQHATGWASLVWRWTMNTWRALIFKKIRDKEWEEVR